MRTPTFRRGHRNSRKGSRDGELHPFRRLDAMGVFSLLVVIAFGLAVLFTISAPSASADRDADKSLGGTNAPVLDKKFKGDLPITELTEDQAIAHALNRLAYGPRPGDVERIRQMGLAKWIDMQLDPDSINDSALDKRLEKYSTLKMSSKQLVETYPQQNQAAKKKGLTKQEYEEQ